jgi:aspartate racemase
MSNKLMKKAGLIGGVSWHSTVELYRLVNEYVATELGGLNSAEIVITSVNLQRIIGAQTSEEKANVLAEAAINLQKAGADFIALGSNGLHQFEQQFMKNIDIPFLHIADCVAQAITERGVSAVGLLGVQETMRDDFYISHLSERGIQTIIPTADECDFIDRVLYEETGKGVVNPSSVTQFYSISEKLMEKGADGIILGCTEIGMLMQQDNTTIPLFDSTEIYAQAIARACLDTNPKL